MARLLPPLALVYHGVGDVSRRRDRHGLFVAADDLRRHVDRLRGWGYVLVSFGELAGRARAGDATGRAALTFDDGLVDNLDVLVPLLERVSAPATVFVVSDWLGRPHPDAPWTRILTADEVVALAAAGVEVGSHGRTHRDLTSLAPEDALAELAESREALAALTGRRVEVLAYPFGRASRDTAAAARRAGYAAAGRTSGEGAWDEPYNLPRQDMNNGSTMLGLRLKRDDRYEPLMRLWPARALRGLVRRTRAAAS